MVKMMSVTAVVTALQIAVAPTAVQGQSDGVGAFVFGEFQEDDGKPIEARKINDKSAGKINSNDDNKAMESLLYLQRFGYIKPDVSLRLNVGDDDGKHGTQPLISTTNDDVEKAIADFQEFAGLDVTGKLDTATLELMATPRCGVADKNSGNELKRFKRYSAHFSSWPKRTLSYHVSGYPTDTTLTRAQVEAVVDKAFQAWEQVTELTFFKASSEARADISLNFFRGSHGVDEPAFDGRGGVLAHAFYPRFGGDVHFDDSEDWLINRDDNRIRRGAKQFLQTAVHEIGHSLGLEHSRDRRAIMAPFYQGWMDVVALQTDDILGIQSIYGERKNRNPKEVPGFSTTLSTITSTIRTTTAATPGSTVVTTGINNVNICLNPQFDAITQTADGSFYVFQENFYWKLRKHQAGFETGYPRPISDWSGIPGKIDAAFFNPIDKMTYIFKGSKVGKYMNLNIQTGYPRKISEEFPGLGNLNQVSAGLVWGPGNHIFIFKNNLYWKLDPVSKQLEDASYPKQISSNWRGIPNNLDAAVKWANGFTYFFKGGRYYRLDDRRVAVDISQRIRYPRAIGKWWLGCSSHERHFTPDDSGEEGRGSLSSTTASTAIDVVTDSNRNPRWNWSR